ncbi:MAG TPA: GDYXXLXY domain-containing protein [Gammaproteobacteria bacterium]
MRNKLVLVLIACQLIVLTIMAGKREYIRAYGTEIYLRTAPIDPNDPFRGEFVRLRYPMSSVNPKQLRGTVEQHRDDKDYPVYAVLTPNAGGIYVLDYLTDEAPTQGMFIKGYLSNDWHLRGWNGTSIGVRYGIEQYFVEQGQGPKLEELMGQRNELQIPLEMRVAVGDDGTSLIKDHRLSALGIKLEMLRVNTRDANTQTAPTNLPLSPKIKVTLRNVSAGELTLVDPGEHCGFKLVPVEWTLQTYQAADKSCERIALDKNALITLQPLEEYAVELELSAARWHIRSENKTLEIGALPTPDMFRIVYHSPDAVQIAALDETHNIWRGELPSSAFNSSGRID